jgi:hypothetical protein
MKTIYQPEHKKVNFLVSKTFQNMGEFVTWAQKQKGSDFRKLSEENPILYKKIIQLRDSLGFWSATFPSRRIETFKD